MKLKVIKLSASLLLVPLICGAISVLSPKCAVAGEFVFDSLSVSNVSNSGPYMSGYTFPLEWSQETYGAGSVTRYGDSHLTISIGANAWCSATILEHGPEAPDLGDNATSYFLVEAQAGWHWDGPPGASPAVSMITQLSTYGTVNIAGHEEVTGGSQALSEEQATGIALASISPKSDTNSSWGTVGRTESQYYPTTDSQCASLSNVQYDFTPDSEGAQWSESADYTIECHASYWTDAGASAITAYAKAKCEATISAWGWAAPSGRVWVGAYASASANGTADIKLDQ